MKESDLTAIEARAVKLPDIHHATDIGALCVEIRRLRGLVKSRETVRHEDGCGNHEFMCPWCWTERPSSGDAYAGPQPHSERCEAFNQDGSVK